MAEIWEIEEIEFLKGNFHYEKCRPYRLWYEYLRLSPIYHQAHKMRTYKGGLTKEEIKALPDDFDKVLETYDRFGNVYKFPFRMWWTDSTGIGKAYLFGQPSQKTRAYPMTYVPQDYIMNSDSCNESIARYGKNNSNFMVLAIPLNASRAEILRAVSEEIDDEYLNPPKAIYSLHGERFHYETVSTSLRLLLMKASDPKLSLWKLGVKAGVSEKYSDLDITVTRIPHNMVEATQVLENITCRMLSNSLLIMENAARGKFPCKDKVAIPKINYRYMWQCMRRRLESNERWAKLFMSVFTRTPSKNHNEDWHDNLLAIDPEFHLRLELSKLKAKKNFLEKQLSLHKPRDPQSEHLPFK
jgi:hypothetical protein